MESTRKRKSRVRLITNEGRQMIANVYHFLKEEYEFTELHREPNCDISHLRNITQRTASATGVSERTVQNVLREERYSKKKDDAGTFSNILSKKNRTKKANKVVETDSEEEQMIVEQEIFVKEEYEFTKPYFEPYDDISNLPIKQPTAAATGDSELTVQTILKEERDMSTKRDDNSTSSIITPKTEQREQIKSSKLTEEEQKIVVKEEPFI